MISLADMRYGTPAERELPAVWALTGDRAAPSFTRAAVPPVEERDPGGAVSENPTDMGLAQEGGNGPPLASKEATRERASGCGWKLTYESELNRVFLDLVEV